MTNDSIQHLLINIFHSHFFQVSVRVIHVIFITVEENLVIFELWN